MRVLGIDPGLTRCGLGVVDSWPGQKMALVAVGVIRTDIHLETGQRLLRVERDLDKWIRNVQPDQVAVERVFSQHNLHSVAATMQAAGIAMMVAARYGIDVALHTPTEVKAAISGSGSADKAQVAAMVAKILGLTQPPSPPDAADAIAIAICHIWRNGPTNRLAIQAGIGRA